MKQLKKYYAENPMSLAIDDIGPYYDASEADAAFATLQWERDGACVRIMVLEDQAEKDRDFIAQQSHGFADAIREREERHAEEIERLKAQHVKALMRIAVKHFDEIESLRKQAERYEKLRKLSAGDFASIRRDSIRANRPMYEAFDALVDQLPASGEAQK